MMGARTNDGGFSLVETMVATFLFALVAAAGVAILSGYQSGRMGLQAADERLAAVDMARALMRADMLEAVNRPVRDPFGGAGSAFEGGVHLGAEGLVEFVRGGNMGARIGGGESAVDRVDYRFENGQLVRRAYARADRTVDTPFTDRVLLSGLQKAEVRFDADGIWIDDWRGRDSGSLPKMAEFTLTFDTGRSLRLLFMVGTGA
ncbi:MAG: type II secretion system protein GspJ [Alphaproteobacteria bacterium]|nr:MAG: type II secretion system protein GspJ [Alphaproteobacteria bacterium]